LELIRLSAAPYSMTMTLGRRANGQEGAYNRLIEDGERDNDTAQVQTQTQTETQSGCDESTPLSANDDDGPSEEDGGIVVVILDTKEQKFRVKASPNWTVSEFKAHSARVHKVSPASQRLIYRGRLLEDSKTLHESSLTDSETIVHLFPKPRMIIKPTTDNETQVSSAQSTSTQGDISSNSVSDDPQAHIPQIVVDDTLYSGIITTDELFEAQQRVKLLSFILLIISSMELLTLITIFLGPDDATGAGTDDLTPGNPTDYVPSTAYGYGGDDEQLRSWRQTDYLDVIVSAAGVYVALLGLRASTENTPDLALKYFVGLIFVGVGWLGYYFFLSIIGVQKQQEDSATSNDAASGGDGSSGDNPSQGENAAPPPGSTYADAAMGLMLPMMVWLTCFLRAWQFRVMLLDAQRETLERHEEQHRHLRQQNAAHEGGDLTLAEIV